MADKTVYFINGMPRSGSTLLCNILAQNPDFHATPTSGLAELITSMHQYWNNNPVMKSSETWEREKVIIRQLIQAWHHDTDRPIVFNKSRGWMPNIEILQNVLDYPVKILTTIRPIPNILASFEKLYRKELNTMNTPMVTDGSMRTIESRLSTWTSENGIVGSAFNSIRDAVTRGHGDKICFIGFDGLTSQPGSTMAGIYNFMGLPYYNHDFNNVIQYTRENDREHGFTDLHTIRQAIRPVADDAQQILGSAFETYKNFNYNF